MPKRFLTVVLGMAFVLFCGSVPVFSAQTEPDSAKREYISYYGTIAAINPLIGEIIIMGSREDREDEDVIVKLPVDPEKVDVVDIRQNHIEFSDLLKGEYVNIECLVKDDAVFVEYIQAYSQKDF